MRILKISGLIIVLSMGAFLIVFGEHDDSPGAQFLGLLIATAAFWGMFKQLRRNRF